MANSVIEELTLKIVADTQGADAAEKAVERLKKKTSSAEKSAEKDEESREKRKIEFSARRWKKWQSEENKLSSEKDKRRVLGVKELDKEQSENSKKEAMRIAFLSSRAKKWQSEERKLEKEKEKRRKAGLNALEKENKLKEKTAKQESTVQQKRKEQEENLLDIRQKAIIAGAAMAAADIGKRVYAGASDYATKALNLVEEAGRVGVDPSRLSAMAKAAAAKHGGTEEEAVGSLLQFAEKATEAQYGQGNDFLAGLVKAGVSIPQLREEGIGVIPKLSEGLRKRGFGKKEQNLILGKMGLSHNIIKAIQDGKYSEEIADASTRTLSTEKLGEAAQAGSAMIEAGQATETAKRTVLQPVLDWLKDLSAWWTDFSSKNKTVSGVAAGSGSFIKDNTSALGIGGFGLGWLTKKLGNLRTKAPVGGATGGGASLGKKALMASPFLTAVGFALGASNANAGEDEMLARGANGGDSDGSEYYSAKELVKMGIIQKQNVPVMDSAVSGSGSSGAPETKISIDTLNVTTDKNNLEGIWQDAVSKNPLLGTAVQFSRGVR